MFEINEEVQQMKEIRKKILYLPETGSLIYI